MSAEKSKDASPNLPWPDVVKFIRQLGHDIRNNLNAVELQSAYLSELASEGELKEEVKRLREMVSTIGTSLQKLSGALGQTSPNPISYRAADFVDDVKQKVGKEFPKESVLVNWDVKLKDEKLQIDPLIAEQAMLELFDNAIRHERSLKQVTAKAYADGGHFVFELHEPKAEFDLSTDNWGREPLRYVGQSHYGLGLNRVRVIIEAHGGKFGAEFDRSTSTLLTKITLPLLN